MPPPIITQAAWDGGILLNRVSLLFEVQGQVLSPNRLGLGHAYSIQFEVALEQFPPSAARTSGDRRGTKLRRRGDFLRSLDTKGEMAVDKDQFHLE